MKKFWNIALPIVAAVTIVWIAVQLWPSTPTVNGYLFKDVKCSADYLNKVIGICNQDCRFGHNPGIGGDVEWKSLCYQTCDSEIGLLFAKCKAKGGIQ